MADLVKLNAPEDAGSVSFAGVEYPVADGSVSVPAEAVDVLASHGYTIPKSRGK
jgi:hypothetical protein